MMSKQNQALRKLYARLLLLSLVITCCIAPVVRAAELTADQWVALFEAQAAQLKSVDANFELERVGKEKLDIQMKHEFGTPRFYGTLIRKVGDKGVPMVQTYVRNEKQQWLAEPEDGENSKDAPGTWRVDLGTTEKSVVPDAIAMGWFFPDHLRGLVVPFHIRMKLGAEGTGVVMQFRNARRADAEGKYVVTLDFTKDKQPPMTLEYNVDISDGFRILSVSGYGDVRGEKKVGIQQEATDFKKIEGIWIPMAFKERLFDMGSSTWTEWKIKVHNIRVNPTFLASDFVYEPPFGSQVFAPGAVQYRLGYKDPTAKLGQDEKDTRVLDARLKRLRKQATTQPAK